jgi:hypothetical protein
VKVRGAGIRSTLFAIEELYGKAGLEHVKEALPPHLRAELEPALLPVKWYPVEIPATIHFTVRDAFGGGTWDASHKLGVAASRIDLTGIYRVLVRAVQYNTIWDRTEQAWSRYNSQGDARWVERGPSSAIGIIRGVGGFNMGLWCSVAGRTEEMLRMSGVKSASVVVAEGTPTSARLDAVWVP